MNKQQVTPTSPSPARRVFLQQSGIAITSFTMPWAFTATNAAALALTASPSACTGVIGLHWDQAYVDMTGAAFPYQACGVTGAAQVVTVLNETEWRMTHPYL